MSGSVENKTAMKIANSPQLCRPRLRVTAIRRTASSTKNPEEAKPSDEKGQLKEGKSAVDNVRSRYRSTVKYLKKMKARTNNKRPRFNQEK